MLQVYSPPSYLHHPLTVQSILPSHTAHESVLEDVCWIPLGIESLFITPLGGMFPLQPEGGEKGVDEDMIQLHVPQGAVRADGEGVLEVRYAVIPDGPFRTPEGYKLCSMAVYLYYNPHQTTKPFYLKLPNWSDAAEHPTFVTSPHTLPEGEKHYQFHLLEGGEFNERYGTLEVDGHSTLFGQAYRLEDTSRYYASLWERDERNARHSRVAITYADQVWIQVSVLGVLLLQLDLLSYCNHLDPKALLEELEQGSQCTVSVCWRPHRRHSGWGAGEGVGRIYSWSKQGRY